MEVFDDLVCPKRLNLSPEQVKKTIDGVAVFVSTVSGE